MRVVVGSLLVAGALLLLTPASALADDPVDLHGAYVLDRSGVLGSTAEVEGALDTLFDDTGAKVFVVYVDSFDNPADAQSWADESASVSGLGDEDLLLAIATQDRTYAVSTGTGFPVSDDGLDSIVGDRLIPALRQDDWEGGAIGFADGVRAALAPSPVPAIVGGVAAGGVATAIVVAVVRSRRTKKKAADELAALDQKAGTLLVQLDDALKTSEQELGFAQAQFGDAQTKDFVAALADAKKLAGQAFELRQKLDDAYPETPEQKRAMTEQLIQLAEQADAVLDAQAEAFDQLRELEKNAPQVLERVAGDRKGLEARIAAAETTIADLAATHPKADLASLHGLPSQARKLDRFAERTVADARKVLGKAKTGQDAGVAVAVRAAQQAVGQVEQLLASVERVKADLAAQAERDAKTAAELEAQTRDARSAVDAAQDYITTHRGAVGSTARTRISEATRHLDDGVKLAATDPARALIEVQQAVSMAGAALALARDDVDDAESRLAAREQSYYPASPSYPGSGGGSGRDDAFDGALLGGILGELFGGGGSSSSSSSGSWWGGGSSSGSSWGGSGWGGGSSHHSSGGGLFGGGGGGHSSGGSRTSGRRGSSGRF